MNRGPREEHPILGDFRLERLLARGGMALVYEAHQISLSRRVALKVIEPGIAAGDAYREQFAREARAAVALVHPNVVPVYDAGEADGQLYIAMRLIEGENLKEIIDAQQPLAPARVLDLVRQVAAGLDAAHASRVVHRDVKPGNVMVEQLAAGREHCYVVDFGLAVEQDAISVSGAGAWLGTPASVSPEQLRGERVDARTDVYAFGVLIFHALTGRPPYAREHREGTLLAHLHASPPALTDLRPELPLAVDAVIARAMAKNPQARYSSAGELAAALAQALAGDGAIAADSFEGGDSRDRRPLGNLTAELSSFVGRRAELAALRETLGHARLVSLVGPGGIGKTTLALHLAASASSAYAGVWVVELDAVQDAAGLELALARTLGLRISSPEEIRADLIEFIAERPLLLLLDNCEHLLAEAGLLAGELLAACPSLTILATSREQLAREGEHVHAVQALDTPDEDDEADDVLGSDAARLLIDRAGEQGVDVPLDAAATAGIARICVRLEGIPLAIELAAAQLRTLSVAELDRRLQADLGVLARAGGGGPERQRTLAGLIDWSWRLLRQDEQEVLTRLAVFAGSFTLDAAEAVAASGSGDAAGAGALVLALADKSLLQIDANRAQARFRMLQPVREFCLAKALDNSSARAAHRAYYLALAERAEPLLDSAQAAEWLGRLEDDQANLRAAIESALPDGDPESALRTGLAMQQFWACRGLAGEGIELLTAVLDGDSSASAPELRAKAHSGVAHLAAGLLGDALGAEPHAIEALRLARATGDADTAAEALVWLSWSESFAGRAAEGLARAQEALATEASIEDPAVLGRLLDAQAFALGRLGETGAAERAYERARSVFAEADYPPGIALVENHLGDLGLSTGDLAGAAAHFAVARATAERAGDGASVAMAALNLALIDYLEGSRDSARELFVDSLMTNQACGDRANIAFSIFGLALTEQADTRAAELHGSAGHRLEQLDIVLSSLEGRLQTEELERLRSALGATELDRRLDRGRQLAVDDILVALLGAEQSVAG